MCIYRETDKQTDRQADRQTDRQTDREREREKESGMPQAHNVDLQRDRQTDRQTAKHFTSMRSNTIPPISWYNIESASQKLCHIAKRQPRAAQSASAAKGSPKPKAKPGFHAG